MRNYYHHRPDNENWSFNHFIVAALAFILLILFFTSCSSNIKTEDQPVPVSYFKIIVHNNNMTSDTTKTFSIQ